MVCSINVLPAPPVCNWDIIGYVGAAYEGAGLRGRALHERTYADVREQCERSYTLLTQGNAYRQAIAASPEALEAQLPFYRVKVLYARVLGTIASAGRSPAAATLWIARLGYLATGLVTMLWLTRHLGVWKATLASALLLSVPGVVELGLLSTPDGVSVALLLLSAYAMTRRLPALSLTMGVASIWVRPDNLVWLGVLGGYLLVTDRRWRWDVGVAFTLGLISYLAVAAISGSYGWSVQIYQQFVERTADPGATAGLVGLPEYVALLARASHPSNLPPLLLLVATVGLAAGYARWSLRMSRDVVGDLLFVGAGYVALHWLAYPAEDRLILAGYLMILMASMVTIEQLIASSRPSAARPAAG